MNEDIDALIHGYLDEVLSPQQEAELNAWIKASPDNARRFTDAVAIHDQLGNMIRAGRHTAVLSAAPAVPRPAPSGRWRRVTLSAFLSGVAALVLFGVWWTLTMPVAAAAVLDQLIDTAANRVDRTYRIRLLDNEPEQFDERHPPLDGAILHVRQPDSYVLIRQLPDGRKVVTGSDGERSWTILPHRVVRVSNDPLRFRGPLPGNQHGIPFVDLRSDLVQLRHAYSLAVVPPQSNGWHGLRAEHGSAAQRGPRRVELWYDPRTLVIHRMLFDGLPRGRGGPNSVAIDLVEQRDLGPTFFQHEAHHGPDYRVIEEE